MHQYIASSIVFMRCHLCLSDSLTQNSTPNGQCCTKVQSERTLYIADDGEWCDDINMTISISIQFQLGRVLQRLLTSRAGQITIISNLTVSSQQRLFLSGQEVEWQCQSHLRQFLASRAYILALFVICTAVCLFVFKIKLKLN